MTNDINFEVFAEIVKTITKKNGFLDWKATAIECNKHFNDNASAEAWRCRYYRRKKHVTPESKSDYNISKKKLIDDLSKPKTIPTLEKSLKLSRYEILGLIKEVNDEGLYQIIENNNGYQINKNIAQPKRVYNHFSGDVKEFHIMVISDSHMGSIYEQTAYLDFLYKEAKKRGIQTVYHIGDITDGHYTNRPIQLYSLTAIGFDAQVKNIVDHYPHEDGITTYFILGNHDETHIKNGGANVGIAIARERSDMKYLGIGSARIMLTPKCSADLVHPLDGSAYALSYSGQKYMDALTGGDKPNIIFMGHHHKAMYMFYRNIHYFEVPSTCLQSDWEKRMRINNTAGAWILNIKIDDAGSVVSMTNELIPYYANKIEG